MKVYCVLILIFLFSFSTAKENYVFKPKKELRNSTQVFSNLSKQTRNRLFSLLVGEKRGLSTDERKAFSHLGLFHLLTPSGLHYSSLLKLPKLFLANKIFVIINILIFFILKYFESFSAITRVVLYHSLKSILPNLKVKKSHTAFIIAFIIDLLTSSFNSSGLSFLFSFLFWGTIMFYSERKVLCLWLLFLSQMFVSSLMIQEINPIALFLNPLISSLFILFYLPTLFLSFLSLISFNFSLHSILIDFFFKIVIYLDQTFSFLITRPSLALFLVLLFATIFKKKSHLILIILFFLPFNHKIEITKPSISKSIKSTTFIPRPSSIKLKKYNESGFRIYSSKVNCRFKLIDYYWDVRCFKKKPRHSRGLEAISLSYLK